MKILLYKICLLVTIYGLNQDSILSYNEHFELALSHFQKDRFLLAEDEFKKILIDKRNYEDPVSHFFLARAQFEQNKMILCQRTCNSYLNKYPQSPYDSYVRTMLIDINISKENFHSAFDQLLKARISVEDSLIIMKLDQRILNCIMIGINSDNLV